MKSILMLLLLAALVIPRTATLAWDNATKTTWEYRLYENTCHINGNGVTKGTTTRPEIKLGDICSMKWIYIQVRAIRNGLQSAWTEAVIK